MTHPHFHAESSVRLWGGNIGDYQPVHDWLDATKEQFADFRHRALRHHSHGIFEAERIFGKTIVNSDGRHVPVRYIAEQHVKEDCGGRIPTVADWLSQLRPAPWMSRGYPPDRRLARLPGEGEEENQKAESGA
jgi:hypothetical protein